MSSFSLVAEVSSDRPDAIAGVLGELAQMTVTATPSGFHIEGKVEGADARELNRDLLSLLRRTEKRTRLRSQWSGGGTTYRFFDYVLKSTWPTGEAT